MKNLYFLCIVLLLTACQDNQDHNSIIDPNNLLIGFWGNASYMNNQITFERRSSMPANAYGISFMEDGSFKESTSGWCGTPPLSFFIVDGTWQLENVIIDISTQSFPNSYRWEIISLSEETLVVQRQLSLQEQEHRALMDLFQEITDIATSVSCSNASDWSFVPYGSKPCGGPWGYIAYSNQIDVTAFLAKVEAYTLAEHNYNVNWGIISTCDITAQPTGISCVNGSAVLNY